MSVLMTMRVTGDATKLEQMAAENRGMYADIVARAREMGAIHHRFYGSDTEVLVVDEWPDAESFQRFFESSSEIGQMMQSAGVTSAPDVTFWRPLDIGDDF